MATANRVERGLLEENYRRLRKDGIAHCDDINRAVENTYNVKALKKLQEQADSLVIIARAQKDEDAEIAACEARLRAGFKIFDAERAIEENRNKTFVMIEAKIATLVVWVIALGFAYGVWGVCKFLLPAVLAFLRPLMQQFTH
jgi:hypothetical protein